MANIFQQASLEDLIKGQRALEKRIEAGDDVEDMLALIKMYIGLRKGIAEQNETN